MRMEHSMWLRRRYPTRQVLWLVPVRTTDLEAASQRSQDAEPAFGPVHDETLIVPVPDELNTVQLLGAKIWNPTTGAWESDESCPVRFVVVPPFERTSVTRSITSMTAGSQTERG